MSMKLLIKKSREYKGKSYYKYFVYIPNKVRKHLGWEAGGELEVEVERKNLVIRKKTS